MLTKDILKTPLTTELVMVNPNAYLHRSYKNPANLPEDKALIGKLVSYDTYEDSHRTDTSAVSPHFTKTTSDKTKRFLMELTDSVGNTVYRVFPASDIIATKVDMEPRWVNARKVQAEQNAKVLAEKQAKESIEEKRQAEEQSLRQAVKDNLIALFGNNWEQMGVDMNWVRIETRVSQDAQGNPVAKLETTGRIDIPVHHFMRMVERFANQ